MASINSSNNNEPNVFSNSDAASNPDSVFSSMIHSVLRSHFAEHSLDGDEESKTESNEAIDDHDTYTSDEAQTETNQTNHVGNTGDANNIFFNQQEFESLRHLMEPQYQSDYEDEHSLFGNVQLIESFFSESESAESPPPQFYTEEQIFLISVDRIKKTLNLFQNVHPSEYKRMDNYCLTMNYNFDLMRMDSSKIPLMSEEHREEIKRYLNEHRSSEAVPFWHHIQFEKNLQPKSQIYSWAIATYRSLLDF